MENTIWVAVGCIVAVVISVICTYISANYANKEETETSKPRHWYDAEIANSDITLMIEEDNWIVEYDKTRGMYCVTYFEDDHFKDECWFNEYKTQEG